MDYHGNSYDSSDGLPERGSARDMLARGDRRIRHLVEKAPPLNEEEWFNSTKEQSGNDSALSPLTPGSSSWAGSKDRLLVTCTVSHFPADGSQPTVAGGPCSRWLATTEQCYVRKATVGESWQPLPDGWLKEAGMLLITNEKVRWAAQPTAEERAAAEAKVLEVGMAVVGPSTSSPALNQAIENLKPGYIQPFALVRPGESVRLEPVDLATLRLRCRMGESRITVSVFPT